MITAKIIKIDIIKRSFNEGEAFKRIYFLDEKKKWFKTDLVPTFRNYHRWQKLLKVGNVLFNLRLKGEDTIDADSFPILKENENIKQKKLL